MALPALFSSHLTQLHAPTLDDKSTAPSLTKTYDLPPTPPLSDDDDELKSHLDVYADRPRAHAEHPLVFERHMGDTELSYYLPSRADGVNDMYLHLGFRAPARLLTPARVRAAWAYMRLIHPPLASHVLMEPFSYSSARFAYSPPRSVPEALALASATLEFKAEAKDALIDAYLNGPRTLGDDRLAYLILGNVPEEERRATALPTPAPTPTPSILERDEALTMEEKSDDDVREFDFLICAAHFLGDGMALHTFANEFFTLIAGKDADGSDKSTEAIEEMLEREWEARWGSEFEKRDANSNSNGSAGLGGEVLPPSVEEALPRVDGRFRNAAAKVDFKNSEAKNIGGHAFERKKSQDRRTVVPTVSLDANKTKAVLKRCKENGVSVANAIFALSALAWSRMKRGEGGELPVMMYTALNVRPYLRKEATLEGKSYWFTAIGYLNVVLPAFLPSVDNDNGEETQSDTVRRTFWHRARMAKSQISSAAKHPMLVSRTHEMARVRGERARTWAREDDEKDAGIWRAPPPPPPPPASSVSSVSKPVNPSSSEQSDPKPWTLPRAPSTALIGLSMLGNLDAMYAHDAYPALELHTLTTGSRQRKGAALLFGYTFKGRLWLSLGFDEEGFGEGVWGWWREVLSGVEEFFF